MTNVVRFKPKPVCTNIHVTCTWDDCPLKRLYKQLGPGHFLGSCSGYIAKLLRDERASEPQSPQR